MTAFGQAFVFSIVFLVLVVPSTILFGWLSLRASQHANNQFGRPQQF